MALTSAMQVGFSGIKSNSVAVDTVGNNLANLNTTAFKNQRTLFETLLYQTIDEGSAPSALGGGELPQQIGTGSTVATIQRDFRQGGLESTGFQGDLALDGRGFFILQGANGTNLYTRDGAFRLDAEQTFVAANGSPVQVFAADAGGTIQVGTLSNLVIPLGTAREAIATGNVVMNGQLDASSAPATVGAISISQSMLTAGGAAATDTTPLTNIVSADGVPLFADGDELEISASKGGISVEGDSFIVGTTGTTLGDLAGHLESVFGISTDAAFGGAPGVTIGDGVDAPAGSLVVTSNLGQISALELDAGSIVNKTGVIASPFSFATTQEAAGDGVTTSFGVFDSLGNLVDVRLRASLESRSDTGTTWRFYAESEGDSDLSPLLGTGTITFDANGQFVGATGTDLAIDRAGSGAASPLAFSLDFSALTGLASADGSSVLVMADQDGAPTGIMTNYSIDADGIVTGSYSNQQTRVLGQIAVATFRNEEGLIGQSANTFVEGVNSGEVIIGAARTGTAGSIVAGALEQGNVDIAREFINLISAQTGISSASRVVRVADELLQELLLLAR